MAGPFRPEHRVEIDVRRGDERRSVAVEPSPALFVREVEDFIAAALEGRAPVVSLDESRGNAAALAALHASARQGTPVAVA